jgi:hypothetical protein
VFYYAPVLRPDADRILAAQIAGAAARHARSRPLTPQEEAAAVAELKEIAGGRRDLLAEHAGTARGFGERHFDPGRYEQIAALCTAAGADPALIAQWVEVGRRRAAEAAVIPYAGLP